jgi:hypothetical protein
MKFRPQRGSLAESMAEVVELPATRHALAKHLGEPDRAILVTEYAYDDRIGWGTHLVTVWGSAVGYTDEGVTL